MKNNSEILSRRKFIQKSSTAVIASSLSGIVTAGAVLGNTNRGNKMPYRTLGKTGLKVSLLSFGGGSKFLKNGPGDWENSLDTALKSGINLFDTAPNYFVAGSNKTIDKSEVRFGEVLPPFRKQIILSTKVDSRDTELMKKDFEASLKNMKTDYIDILMIHAIAPSDTVSAIEKGLYKEMVKLKESGAIRHIGFSSMDSAERSKDMLEHLDFDVVLLAMNATRFGDYANITLPIARKKNVGVISMKIMRNIVGRNNTTAKELLEYAWTQEGVASTLISHEDIKHLKENIKLAQKFHDRKGRASIQRSELEYRMSKYAGPHVLCWAQPGYHDGEIMV